MGITDRLIKLMGIVKKGKLSANDRDFLNECLQLKSNSLVLGRILGYSISEYAVACLKWLSLDDEYNRYISKLTKNDKEFIEKLVKSKRYLDF